MPSRLYNKTALIVGGGQTNGEDLGNGRAISLLFAREGARVVIAARHEETAAETVRMIREENPDAEATAVACDMQHITDYTAIKSRLKSNVSGYLYKTTRRSPMILPVITEV